MVWCGVCVCVCVCGVVWHTLRPIQLQSFRARLAKGMYHRNPLLSQHNTHGFGGDDGSGDGDGGEASAAKCPAHLRCFLDEGSLRLLHPVKATADEKEGGWESHFTGSVDSAVSTVWTKKGLCHESDTTASCCYHANNHDSHDGAAAASSGGDGDPGGDEQCTAEGAAAARSASGDGHIDDASEARRLLMGPSIVVGLHPDQATEPILDHAIALGKPFAVIPCCVYADEFPKRHLRASPADRVTSYEDFIKYLCEKHPKISQSTLPFEGKNILLWWPGADQSD